MRFSTCLVSFIFFYFPCLLAHVSDKSSSLTIGIISAVSGESGRLIEQMENVTSEEKGKRIYHQGRLHGIDTVFVTSRIGKIAAATATTHLIVDYKVNLIVFIGVAGALDNSLNIGDVVIGNSLIQHDMDARPICPQYSIPLLNKKMCQSDPLLTLLAFQASQKFLETKLQQVIPNSTLQQFGIHAAKVANGLIITGDQIISEYQSKKELKEKLPEALCVEMEGASIAQVCYEYATPCVVIRTISDYANHKEQPTNIKDFIECISGYYCEGIIKNLYKTIGESYFATTAKEIIE